MFKWLKDVTLSPAGSGVGTISFPAAHDPTHGAAWMAVACGREDASEVRDDNDDWLFRAWRVSPTSFAWQTRAMAAPAFEAYL